MKKALIVVSIIAAAIAAAVFIPRLIERSGKAYVLASDLKKAGLPADEIRVNEKGGMYNEASALGENLNVKIGYYGNGLFMDSIIKNLEAEKTKKTEPGVYKPAILVSRLYILVVYAEPEKGMVKRFLANKFGQVREY